MGSKCIYKFNKNVIKLTASFLCDRSFFLCFNMNMRPTKTSYIVSDERSYYDFVPGDSSDSSSLYFNYLYSLLKSLCILIGLNDLCIC